MSTKKGNAQRTRAQKHQNTFKFKNDLHDTSPGIKLVNSIKIDEVCGRCAAIIEWKRQYRKYKPLTKPNTCNKCGNRTVKKAYHMICTPCATEARCCAKCLVSADEAQIIPPAKTELEEIKERAEIDKALKCLPERRRRTFLRYLNKKKKVSTTETQPDTDPDDLKTQEEKLKAEEEKLKKFITAADLDKEEMDLVRRMEEKLGFLWDLEDETSNIDSDALESDFDEEEEESSAI